MRRFQYTLAVVLALSLTASQAEERVYPRGELLLEPATLVTRLDSGKYVLVDAREKAAYDKGHIPGALQVDPAEWARAFGDGQDARGWSTRIGKLGISAEDSVVVYDDNYAKDAARVWWILRYWGVRDVKLLNGGWTGWQGAKGPVQTGTPPSRPAADFVAKPRRETLATKEQLLKSLEGKGLQIVDARSKNEHCGLEALKNKRAGAIPGAKHLEWSDLLEKESRRFKPSAELKKLFAAANIDLAGNVAAHCQSGGRSSVMVFALELMGAEHVSNYYAGWNEWGNTDDTPIVKPPADK